MKTPEEIKRGLINMALEYYSLREKNPVCIFYGEDWCSACKNAEYLAMIWKLKAENAELKRERDAAIHDVSQIGQCKVCKHGQSEYIPNECLDCIRRSSFEWRGPRYGSG